MSQWKGMRALALLAALLTVFCGAFAQAEPEGASVYDAAFASRKMQLVPCAENGTLENVLSVSPRGAYILAIGKKWAKDPQYQAMAAYLPEDQISDALYLENTKTGAVTLVMPEGAETDDVDERLTRFFQTPQSLKYALNFAWSPDERYAAITSYRFIEKNNAPSNLMLLDTATANTQTAPAEYGGFPYAVIYTLVKWSGDSLYDYNFGTAYNACFSPDSQTLFYSAIESYAEKSHNYSLTAYDLASGESSRVIENSWTDKRGGTYKALTRDLLVTSAGTIIQTGFSGDRQGMRYIFNDGNVTETALGTLPIRRAVISPASGFGFILFSLQDGDDSFGAATLIDPDKRLPGGEFTLLLTCEKGMDFYSSLSSAKELLQNNETKYSGAFIADAAFSPDGQYALLLTACDENYSLLLMNVSSGAFQDVSASIPQEKLYHMLLESWSGQTIFWEPNNRVYLRCEAKNNRIVPACYSFTEIEVSADEPPVSTVDSRGLAARIRQYQRNMLTGTWYFVSDPDDTFTFLPDGTYTSVSTITGVSRMEFEGVYEIDGDQLTLKTTYYGEKTASTQAFAIDGDEMTWGNDTLRRMTE